jgi:hypothetical protein
MPVSESQKRANKNWRMSHKEQFYAYKKTADKKYYEEHKEEIANRQIRKYRIRKEFERLLAITI